MDLLKKKIIKKLDIDENFLFLDKAKISINKKSATGFYKVKKNNWVFSSHLKSNPVYPGIFLIESMCQTAMLVIYDTILKVYSNRGVLRSVDIDFINPIDYKNAPINLKIEVKKLSYKRGLSICSIKLKSINNNKLISEGKITHFVSYKYLKKI